MGNSCGGCQYCDFPYEAQLPIIVNDRREIRKFTSKDDVWDIIDLLIDEVHEINKTGKNFDVAQSIVRQIPFFACSNIIFDKEIQKDIQRYLYCKDTNVPPYKGDYGNQPSLWVEKFFLIEEALAKYKKRIIDGNKKESNNKI